MSCGTTALRRASRSPPSFVTSLDKELCACLKAVICVSSTETLGHLAAGTSLPTERPSWPGSPAGAEVLCLTPPEQIPLGQPGAQLTAWVYLSMAEELNHWLRHACRKQKLRTCHSQTMSRETFDNATVTIITITGCTHTCFLGRDANHLYQQTLGWNQTIISRAQRKHARVMQITSFLKTNQMPLRRGPGTWRNVRTQRRDL